MSNYSSLKNSPVFFGGNYMHEARKRFKSMDEAIDAACKNSYSLGNSDIGLFYGAKDSKELNERITEYELDNQDRWNVPSIGMACSYDDDNGLVQYDNEKEPNSFYYQTSTGTNQLLIRKVENENGEIEYEAIYRVESYHPIQLSSAMEEFYKDGWDCRCLLAKLRAKEIADDGKQQYYNIMEISPSYESLKILEEIAMEDRQKEEEESISEMIANKEIIGLEFRVDFDSRDIWDRHDKILNNPQKIKNIIISHPKYANKIYKILEYQKQKIMSIEIPENYECEESVWRERGHHRDICKRTTEYYKQQRNEIVKSIQDVMNFIKNKEYLYAQRDDFWISAEEQFRTRCKVVSRASGVPEEDLYMKSVNSEYEEYEDYEDLEREMEQRDEQKSKKHYPRRTRHRAGEISEDLSETSRTGLATDALEKATNKPKNRSNKKTNR